MRGKKLYLYATACDDTFLSIEGTKENLWTKQLKFVDFWLVF